MPDPRIEYNSQTGTVTIINGDTRTTVTAGAQFGTLFSGFMNDNNITDGDLSGLINDFLSATTNYSRGDKVNLMAQLIAEAQARDPSKVGELMAMQAVLLAEPPLSAEAASNLCNTLMGSRIDEAMDGDHNTRDLADLVRMAQNITDPAARAAFLEGLIARAQISNPALVDDLQALQGLYNGTLTPQQVAQRMNDVQVVIVPLEGGGYYVSPVVWSHYSNGDYQEAGRDDTFHNLGDGRYAMRFDYPTLYSANRDELHNLVHDTRGMEDDYTRMMAIVDGLSEPQRSQAAAELYSIALVQGEPYLSRVREHYPQLSGAYQSVGDFQVAGQSAAEEYFKSIGLGDAASDVRSGIGNWVGGGNHVQGLRTIFTNIGNMPLEDRQYAVDMLMSMIIEQGAGAGRGDRRESAIMVAMIFGEYLAAGGDVDVLNRWYSGTASTYDMMQIAMMSGLRIQDRGGYSGHSEDFWEVATYIFTLDNTNSELTETAAHTVTMVYMMSHFPGPPPEGFGDLADQYQALMMSPEAQRIMAMDTSTPAGLKAQEDAMNALLMDLYGDYRERFAQFVAANPDALTVSGDFARIFHSHNGKVDIGLMAAVLPPEYVRDYLISIAPDWSGVYVPPEFMTGVDPTNAAAAADLLLAHYYGNNTTFASLVTQADGYQQIIAGLTIDETLRTEIGGMGATLWPSSNQYQYARNLIAYVETLDAGARAAFMAGLARSIHRDGDNTDDWMIGDLEFFSNQYPELFALLINDPSFIANLPTPLSEADRAVLQEAGMLDEYEAGVTARTAAPVGTLGGTAPDQWIVNVELQSGITLPGNMTEAQFEAAVGTAMAYYMSRDPAPTPPIDVNAAIEAYIAAGSPTCTWPENHPFRQADFELGDYVMANTGVSYATVGTPSAYVQLDGYTVPGGQVPVTLPAAAPAYTPPVTVTQAAAADYTAWTNDFLQDYQEYVQLSPTGRLLLNVDLADGDGELNDQQKQAVYLYAVMQFSPNVNENSGVTYDDLFGTSPLEDFGNWVTAWAGSMANAEEFADQLTMYNLMAIADIEDPAMREVAWEGYISFLNGLPDDALEGVSKQDLINQANLLGPFVIATGDYRSVQAFYEGDMDERQASLIFAMAGREQILAGGGTEADVQRWLADNRAYIEQHGGDYLSVASSIYMGMNLEDLPQALQDRYNAMMNPESSYWRPTPPANYGQDWALLEAQARVELYAQAVANGTVGDLPAYILVQVEGDIAYLREHNVTLSDNRPYPDLATNPIPVNYDPQDPAVVRAVGNDATQIAVFGIDNYYRAHTDRMQSVYDIVMIGHREGDNTAWVAGDSAVAVPLAQLEAYINGRFGAGTFATFMQCIQSGMTLEQIESAHPEWFTAGPGGQPPLLERGASNEVANWRAYFSSEATRAAETQQLLVNEGIAALQSATGYVPYAQAENVEVETQGSGANLTTTLTVVRDGYTFIITADADGNVTDVQATNPQGQVSHIAFDPAQGYTLDEMYAVVQASPPTYFYYNNSFDIRTPSGLTLNGTTDFVNDRSYLEEGQGTILRFGPRGVGAGTVLQSAAADILGNENQGDMYIVEFNVDEALRDPAQFGRMADFLERTAAGIRAGEIAVNAIGGYIVAGPLGAVVAGGVSGGDGNAQAEFLERVAVLCDAVDHLLVQEELQAIDWVLRNQTNLTDAQIAAMTDDQRRAYIQDHHLQFAVNQRLEPLRDSFSDVFAALDAIMNGGSIELPDPMDVLTVLTSGAEHMSAAEINALISLLPPEMLNREIFAGPPPVTMREALEAYRNIGPLMNEYYINTLEQMGVATAGVDTPREIYDAYRDYLIAHGVSPVPEWRDGMDFTRQMEQLQMLSSGPPPVPFPTNPFTDYNNALMTAAGGGPVPEGFSLIAASDDFFDHSVVAQVAAAIEAPDILGLAQGTTNLLLALESTTELMSLGIDETSYQAVNQASYLGTVGTAGPDGQWGTADDVAGTGVRGYILSELRERGIPVTAELVARLGDASYEELLAYVAGVNAGIGNDIDMTQMPGWIAYTPADPAAIVAARNDPTVMNNLVNPVESLDDARAYVYAQLEADFNATSDPREKERLAELMRQVNGADDTYTLYVLHMINELEAQRPASDAAIERLQASLQTGGTHLTYTELQTIATDANPDIDLTGLNATTETFAENPAGIAQASLVYRLPHTNADIPTPIPEPAAEWLAANPWVVDNGAEANPRYTSREDPLPEPLPAYYVNVAPAGETPVYVIDRTRMTPPETTMEEVLAIQTRLENAPDGLLAALMRNTAELQTILEGMTASPPTRTVNDLLNYFGDGNAALAYSFMALGLADPQYLETLFRTMGIPAQDIPVLIAIFEEGLPDEYIVDQTARITNDGVGAAADIVQNAGERFLTGDFLLDIEGYDAQITALVGWQLLADYNAYAQAHNLPVYATPAEMWAANTDQNPIRVPAPPPDGPLTDIDDRSVALQAEFREGIDILVLLQTLGNEENIPLQQAAEEYLEETYNITINEDGTMHVPTPAPDGQNFNLNTADGLRAATAYLQTLEPPVSMASLVGQGDPALTQAALDGQRSAIVPRMFEENASRDLLVNAANDIGGVDVVNRATINAYYTLQQFPGIDIELMTNVYMQLNDGDPNTPAKADVERLMQGVFDAAYDPPGSDNLRLATHLMIQVMPATTPPTWEVAEYVPGTGGAPGRWVVERDGVDVDVTAQIPGGADGINIFEMAGITLGSLDNPPTDAGRTMNFLGRAYTSLPAAERDAFEEAATLFAGEAIGYPKPVPPAPPLSPQAMDALMDVIMPQLLTTAQSGDFTALFGMLGADTAQEVATLLGMTNPTPEQLLICDILLNVDYLTPENRAILAQWMRDLPPEAFEGGTIHWDRVTLPPQDVLFEIAHDYVQHTPPLTTEAVQGRATFVWNGIQQRITGIMGDADSPMAALIQPIITDALREPYVPAPYEMPAGAFPTTLPPTADVADNAATPNGITGTTTTTSGSIQWVANVQLRDGVPLPAGMTEAQFENAVGTAMAYYMSQTPPPVPPINVEEAIAYYVRSGQCPDPHAFRQAGFDIDTYVTGVSFGQVATPPATSSFVALVHNGTEPGLLAGSIDAALEDGEMSQGEMLRIAASWVRSAPDAATRRTRIEQLQAMVPQLLEGMDEKLVTAVTPLLNEVIANIEFMSDEEIALLANVDFANLNLGDVVAVVDDVFLREPARDFDALMDPDSADFNLQAINNDPEVQEAYARWARVPEMQPAVTPPRQAVTQPDMPFQSQEEYEAWYRAARAQAEQEVERRILLVNGTFESYAGGMFKFATSPIGSMVFGFIGPLLEAFGVVPPGTTEAIRMAAQYRDPDATAAAYMSNPGETGERFIGAVARDEDGRYYLRTADNDRLYLPDGYGAMSEDVQDFYTNLSRMDAAERQAFLAAHPELRVDAEGVIQLPDPDISQFTALTTLMSALPAEGHAPLREMIAFLPEVPPELLDQYLEANLIPYLNAHPELHEQYGYRPGEEPPFAADSPFHVLYTETFVTQHTATHTAYMTVVGDIGQEAAVAASTPFERAQAELVAALVAPNPDTATPGQMAEYGYETQLLMDADTPLELAQADLIAQLDMPDALPDFLAAQQALLAQLPATATQTQRDAILNANNYAELDAAATTAGVEYTPPAGVDDAALLTYNQRVDQIRGTGTAGISTVAQTLGLTLNVDIAALNAEQPEQPAVAPVTSTGVTGGDGAWVANVTLNSGVTLPNASMPMTEAQFEAAVGAAIVQYMATHEPPVDVNAAIAAFNWPAGHPFGQAGFNVETYAANVSLGMTSDRQFVSLQHGTPAVAYTAPDAFPASLPAAAPAWVPSRSPEPEASGETETGTSGGSGDATWVVNLSLTSVPPGWTEAQLEREVGQAIQNWLNTPGNTPPVDINAALAASDNPQLQTLAAAGGLTPYLSTTVTPPISFFDMDAGEFRTLSGYAEPGAAAAPTQQTITRLASGADSHHIGFSIGYTGTLSAQDQADLQSEALFAVNVIAANAARLGLPTDGSVNIYDPAYLAANPELLTIPAGMTVPEGYQTGTVMVDGVAQTALYNDNGQILLGAPDYAIPFDTATVTFDGIATGEGYYQRIAQASQDGIAAAADAQGQDSFASMIEQFVEQFMQALGLSQPEPEPMVVTAGPYSFDVTPNPAWGEIDAAEQSRLQTNTLLAVGWLASADWGTGADEVSVLDFLMSGSPVPTADDLRRIAEASPHIESITVTGNPPVVTVTLVDGTVVTLDRESVGAVVQSGVTQYAAVVDDTALTGAIIQALPADVMTQVRTIQDIEPEDRTNSTYAELARLLGMTPEQVAANFDQMFGNLNWVEGQAIFTDVDMSATLPAPVVGSGVVQQQGMGAGR